MNQSFWRGKKVFITGHTGFKGSWLSIWLSKLGASVIGYSLDPLTEPSIYKICRVRELLSDEAIADVRDGTKLRRFMASVQPEVVFHLAAQPLVRDSYRYPVETITTNVMGTVNVLESIRFTSTVMALVNVTTDKTYLNKGIPYSYHEDDQLGGNDPYSASKAASEMITAAYRSSYFSNPNESFPHVATVRAGNVIGGGDWSKERLIPDVLKAIVNGNSLSIRNPDAIRPWQHVLEPLDGYLMLAEQLSGDQGAFYADAWNFGPNEKEQFSVQWLAEKIIEFWKVPTKIVFEKNNDFREENYIILNHQKASVRLGWKPMWNLPIALEKVVEWYQAYYEGDNDMLSFTIDQINAYERELLK